MIKINREPFSLLSVFMYPMLFNACIHSQMQNECLSIKLIAKNAFSCQAILFIINILIIIILNYKPKSYSNLTKIIIKFTLLYFQKFYNSIFFWGFGVLGMPTKPSSSPTTAKIESSITAGR
jgi:hypothetical protein